MIKFAFEQICFMKFAFDECEPFLASSHPYCRVLNDVCSVCHTYSRISVTNLTFSYLDACRSLRRFQTWTALALLRCHSGQFVVDLSRTHWASQQTPTVTHSVTTSAADVSYGPYSKADWETKPITVTRLPFCRRQITVSTSVMHSQPKSLDASVLS